MARTMVWQDCSEELAQRLRWHVHASLREGAECSLLVVRPMPHGIRAHTAFARTRAVAALVERLRPLIRQTDLIEVDDGQGVGVVLKGADREGAHAVFQRVRDALGGLCGSDATGRIDERSRSGSAGGTGGAGGAHEMAQLVAIGYAGSASEWGDERAVDEAIQAAWKVRSIVTASLPRAEAADERAHTTPAPQPVEAGKPARSRQAGARTRGVATAHERRKHLWLLPAERPGSPEDEALRAKARSLGVPYVTIPARLPATCRRAVPAGLAHELRAVAIGRTRGMLTVAMYDPRDMAAVTRLSAATGLTIFPVLAAPDELERALRHLSAM